jgi:hypothetical protein
MERSSVEIEAHIFNVTRDRSCCVLVNVSVERSCPVDRVAASDPQETPAVIVQDIRGCTYERCWILYIRARQSYYRSLFDLLVI